MLRNQMVNTRKRNIGGNLLLIFFALFSLLSSVLFSRETYDYQMDSFCNSLVNYTKNTIFSYKGGFFSVSPKASTAESVNTLETVFSMTEKKQFSKNGRFVFDQDASFLEGNSVFGSSLISLPQFNLSSSVSSNGFQKLNDRALYLRFPASLNFAPNQFGFVFVNSKVADFLISSGLASDYFGLVGKEVDISWTNPQGIKQYGKHNIANVIVDDMGQYSYLSSLYGDFCLTSDLLEANTCSSFSSHLDYDLSASIFANRKTLEAVSQSAPLSRFAFSFFSITNEGTVSQIGVSQHDVQQAFSNPNSGYINLVFPLLLFSIEFLLFLILEKARSDLLLFDGFSCFLVLAYGFYCCFSYAYYLWGLFFVSFLLAPAIIDFVVKWKRRRVSV